MPNIKPDSRPPRALAVVECCCWFLSVVLIAPYGLAVVGQFFFTSTAASEQDYGASEVAAAAQTLDVGTVWSVPAAKNRQESQAGGQQDQSLWSVSRKLAYQKLVDSGMAPVRSGILHVPSQTKVIPVFAGVNEVSMTLGAGHLLDSSPLLGNGNIAVTSHRDGPFRFLKDLVVGDRFLLQVGNTIRTFSVNRLAIVKPEDVSVLNPTQATTLTLITCYPFYFVGKAPERYIVQARLLPVTETGG
ncbi:class D sortase [Exilibacterium tricleocarpae]|uniref:Class D sortase n=1 Tax=Exilibacterium tricleocarpae TaxID=2591008 RepID=A0A545SMS6_9GAMM|nr:class D sortase [Exilibacterium tricleocarpae]TQV66310.1 class D sortase [Exilibacterium tricleocarpae]